MKTLIVSAAIATLSITSAFAQDAATDRRADGAKRAAVEACIALTDQAAKEACLAEVGSANSLSGRSADRGSNGQGVDRSTAKGANGDAGKARKP